jgi:hypothetical protein
MNRNVELNEEIFTRRRQRHGVSRGPGEILAPPPTTPPLYTCRRVFLLSHPTTVVVNCVGPRPRAPALTAMTCVPSMAASGSRQMMARPARVATRFVTSQLASPPKPPPPVPPTGARPGSTRSEQEHHRAGRRCRAG